MKIAKYIAASVAAVIISACGGKGEAEPGDIVIGFHKAITSMDFDTAAGYCTSGAVNEYLATYQEACTKSLKKDKDATEIAAELLSSTEVVIEKTSKNKGVRTVFYTINDGCGKTKKKIATLKEIEGEWRIAEIKDR